MRPSLDVFVVNSIYSQNIPWMTATRTNLSRSPRTPHTKVNSNELLKGSNSAPFGDGHAERPTPQGALSPSLFDSLQQRANKLKVLLGSLRSSNGVRAVTGGDTESSPQQAAAPGGSASCREAGPNSFSANRRIGSGVIVPGNALARTSKSSKLDSAPRQPGPVANGVTLTGIVGRTRAGSWSSGVRGGSAGSSTQRATQGISHGKMQDRGKDAVSSMILREGSGEMSRGEGEPAQRPPMQRPAPVPAAQHLPFGSRDGAAAVMPGKRRCASDGSAGVPAPAVDKHPPARIQTDPRSNSSPEEKLRFGENSVTDPQANMPLVAAVAGSTSEGLDLVAPPPAVVSTGLIVTSGLENVASTSQPMFFRPHPPLAPPSSQPSWSSSGGEGFRRSSGGGGRRSSAGDNSYSDGSGRENPPHAPPLPPPPPLPAQPPQASPSRSPSSSPRRSSVQAPVGGDAQSGVFLALSSQAQHGPTASLQHPAKVHQSRSHDGCHTPGPEACPIATCALMGEMQPVLGLHPCRPNGVAARVNNPKDPFEAHLPPQPPSLPSNAMASVSSPLAPSRSQAAEELSAILSSLAAVASPLTAVTVPALHEAPQVDLDFNHQKTSGVGALGARLSTPPRSKEGSGSDAAAACTVHDGDGGREPGGRHGAVEPHVGNPSSIDGSIGTAHADSEASLAQALAVARASAMAAFLRPEARVYRLRREGFGNARSGSNSPPAGTSAGGAIGPAPGQVFAGVSAFAAPFSGREAQQPSSPRHSGYLSSGVESARSPCAHRSTSARSSRYEQLLVLQDAIGNNVRPHVKAGRGVTAVGAPGAEFMRRNAVLLKKRQAWASAASEAKRRGSRDSDGSLGSPRQHQAQTRHSRASCTTIHADASDHVPANAGARRCPVSSNAIPQRSLVDLQRWADRRKQRLAVLREEWEAEERARAKAQLTFKPEIGERSRRLAKLARSRPSYVPIPGCGPVPRAQTPPPPAAEPTDTSAAASHPVADPDVGGAEPVSAMASNCPPPQPEGPMGRLSRITSTAQPRPTVATRHSLGGAATRHTRHTRGTASSLSVDNAELLKELHGARAWQRAIACASKEALLQGPSHESAGGSATGSAQGGKAKTAPVPTQLAAARNTRVRGRYATPSVAAYDDPVVGAVADAIKSATAALKLRPAPSQRAHLLTAQGSSQKAVDLETRSRPRARHKVPAFPPASALQPVGSFGRGSRTALTGPSIMGTLAARRRRASVGGVGASGAHGDPQNASSQQQYHLQSQQRHQRRQSAPLGCLDFWESPRVHCPDGNTHGGSCQSLLPASPENGGAGNRSGIPPSPVSPGIQCGLPSSPPAGIIEPGAPGLGIEHPVGSPAAAVLGNLPYDSSSIRTPGSVTGDGGVGVARKTIDILATTGGSAGTSSGGLAVGTGRSPTHGSSTVGFGSDFSGSRSAGPGASLHFSVSADGSSFEGRMAGSPVFFMLGPAAVAGSNDATSPAAAVAAVAATAAAMVGPGGVLVHIPQAVHLSSPSPDGGRDGAALQITAVGLAPPVDGDAGSGGTTLIAAPAAPGGLAVGAFRYGCLTSPQISSFLTLPYDAGSTLVRSASPPILMKSGANASGVLSGGEARPADSLASVATTIADASGADAAVSSAVGDRGVTAPSGQSAPRTSDHALSNGAQSVACGNSLHIPVGVAAAVSDGRCRKITGICVDLIAISLGDPVQRVGCVGDEGVAHAPSGSASHGMPLQPLWGTTASASSVSCRIGTGFAVAQQSAKDLCTAAISSLRPQSAGSGRTNVAAGSQSRRSSSTEVSPQPAQQDGSLASRTSLPSGVACCAGVDASVYPLARSSAPLPMTSSNELQGSPLRGVRFTKILAQQFAASLLLSQPASPSSLKAAAVLGAATAAARGSGHARPVAPLATVPDTANANVCNACSMSGGIVEDNAEEDYGAGRNVGPRSVSVLSGPDSSMLGSRGDESTARDGGAGDASENPETVYFQADLGREELAAAARGPITAAVERQPGDSGDDALTSEVAEHVSARCRTTESASAAAQGTVSGAVASMAAGPLGAGQVPGALGELRENWPINPRRPDPRSAHEAVRTILSRPTVSDGGASGENALSHGVEVVAATGAAVDDDVAQDDPLAALQCLISKMKHLAGDCDAGDCGSDTAGSSRSGSRGGAGSGSGCTRSATESSIAADGGERDAAVAAKLTSLTKGPESLPPGQATMASISGSYPPVASIPGSSSTLEAKGTTDKSHSIHRDVEPKNIDGSGSVGDGGAATTPVNNCEASLALPGPMPVEVLVQRAEQLRASVMGANGRQSRGSSPSPASPACSWTSSTSHHASPYSALGLRQVGPGDVDSSSIAAVIISPVQRCYGGNPVENGGQRPGLVNVSAGSGVPVSPWIMASTGAMRVGSTDVGSEFMFPRLRSNMAATKVTGVRAVQLVPMGESPRPATANQSQPATGEEMLQEISLAGGLEQVPSGDGKAPRRMMPPALASAARELAAAAAQQPRYSVWSLVDHLPAAVTVSAATSASTSSHNTASAAACCTTRTAVAAAQPPAQPSQDVASAAWASSSAGTSSSSALKGCQDPPHSPSTHSSAPSMKAIAAPSSVGPVPVQGGAEPGSDSLTALQSLIRQVAFL